MAGSRPNGRNAVLVTHGYTGSHHAAGRNPKNGNQPGSWDGLIGPGKAIDTDRLFVVAATCWARPTARPMPPASTRATGQPYGPDFPNLTIRDIVAAQKACSTQLGVRHLVAVAGPSYGGYQAFQWAVAYPDFMDAIVPVNTAPWASANTDKQLAEMQARLATAPEWNGGRYYGTAECKTVLTEIRIETLKRYGIEASLARRGVQPAEHETAIRALAANWAENWDANSLLILRRALLGFDTRPDFARIKAKVLYVLCRTDALFPPKIAPGVIDALTRRRGRGPLFRDRQRTRPFLQRPRARLVVAGIARLPRPARRAHWVRVYRPSRRQAASRRPIASSRAAKAGNSGNSLKPVTT